MIQESSHHETNFLYNPYNSSPFSRSLLFLNIPLSGAFLGLLSLSAPRLS